MGISFTYRKKLDEVYNGKMTGTTTMVLDSHRSLSLTALKKSGGGDGNDDGKIEKVDGNVLALSQYPEILTKAANIVGEMKGLTNEEIIEFYKALGLEKKIEQLPAVEKQKKGILSTVSSMTGLSFLKYICGVELNNIEELFKNVVLYLANLARFTTAWTIVI